MRAPPPQELVDLLSRLELASPAEVRAVYRHARRLAKDLTLFDSVWVDALVQGRKLTPFQAAEINVGRGDGLRVGPYVLLAPRPSPAYARSYRAREIGAAREVRLTVIRCQREPDDTLADLQQVMQKSAAIRTPHIIPFEHCGTEGSLVWIVSPRVAGRTAAEWLVHGGRMPPDVVLEIARQMAAALTVCEAAGLVHGDISAQQLVLDPLGTVQLLDPGVRFVVRPGEDCSALELSPEAYDYLAPERVGHGAPSSAAADMYACGALWWHLLAGRPPLAGATGAARRQAAQSTRIRSIHPIASDTPRPLVEAIAQCTERSIERRPAGFAALLALLGPPSDRGQALVARHVARGASPPERLARRVRTMRRSPHAPTWAAAAGGVFLALLVGAWPLWRGWLVATAAQPASVPPQVAGPLSTAVASSTERISPVPAQSPPQAAAAKTAQPVAQPPGIVRATAVVPVRPRDPMPPVSREFVISAARPVAWSQVRPQAGQIVRSRPGERAQIVIPPAGAKLSVENVRFEDVDFTVSRDSSSSAALVVVAARRVSFNRCSFQAAGAGGVPPTAIEWSPGESASGDASSLPSALEMRECVMARVGSGIRCQMGSDSALSFDDVLFLGSGPLVTLDRSPRPGATVDVRLKHCTLRGAACVLELESPATGRPPYAVRIDARECVFATDTDGAVLTAVGGETSTDMLRRVTWRGEGSLVAPHVPLVVWQNLDGKRRAVREAKPAIEGLVRTDFGFAGDAGEGPEASRLVRWQVPLRSGSPPGISDVPLALPRPRQ